MAVYNIAMQVVSFSKQTFGRVYQSYKKVNNHLAIFFLVVAGVLFATSSLTKAQLPAIQQEQIDATRQEATTNEQNVQVYAAKYVTGSIGADVANSLSFITVDANGTARLGRPRPGEKYLSYSPGAMGTVIDYSSKMYIPPATGSEYIAYVKESIQNPFGATPAYAQGLGFSSLRPVLNLWRLFRNLAYFFFVILFLIVGIMIALRKEGGKTAITIQQALPKMVVSLLLITFSYAIAGFMIEIMYLAIYLMIGVFSTPNSIDNQLAWSNLSQIAFQRSIFENGANLFTSVANNVASNFAEMVADIMGSLQQSDAISDVVGIGAGLIMFLVIAVALLVNLFRIFFGLLKAYAGLFFSVIFAPIQLLIGAMPGQNTFGAWIQGILSNLLVFPTVIFFILIANYFTYHPDFNSAGEAGIGGFSPLQIGSNQGVGATMALAFLKFGLLAMLPQAMEIAKQLASGKFNIDAGKAIGDFAKQGRLGGAIGALGIGAGVGLAGGAAVGALNARKAPAGQRWQTIRRDAARGLGVGAGGAAIVGGGLGYAQKALSTVGHLQRDLKSTQELGKGLREAKTNIETRGKIKEAENTDTSAAGGNGSTSGTSEN